MVFWAFALPLFFLSQTRAIPGFSGHGPTKLVGVPDIKDYDKLVYPKHELQDGGSFSHADLTKIVRVSDKAIITQPKPYPVHVPFKVPYPVNVPKPFPVHVPHFVKVPHPVPVEVIKKVPVPIEVPKPYPVPHDEYQGGQGHGDWASSGYSGGIGGGDYKQLSQDDNGQYNNDAYSAGQYQGLGSYGNSGLEHADGDNSADYAAVAQQQQEQHVEATQDVQQSEVAEGH